MSPPSRQPAHSQVAQPPALTLLPGLGDDLSRALAHHLGDVQRAVGLVANGDGTIHGFCLHLQQSSSA